MRITSTYLIHLGCFFFKDHKGLNSSISPKYLLLYTYAWVCAHLPSFHQCLHEAFIFLNLRESYNLQSRKQVVSQGISSNNESTSFPEFINSILFKGREKSQRILQPAKNVIHPKLFFSDWQIPFSSHTVVYWFSFESFKKLNLYSY